MNMMTARRREDAVDDLLRPEAESDEDGAATIQSLIDVAARRWKIVVPVALLVFALIFGAAILSPRKYTATAFVMVNPGKEQVLSQSQTMDGSAAPSPAVVDSEIEILRSYSLRRRTVDALQLDQDPEWNSALRPPSGLSVLTSAIGGLFAKSANDADSAADRSDQVRKSIAVALGDAIAVRRRGASYGIDISVTALSPQSAARVANKFAETYLLSQTEARFEAGQRANSWLGERLGELRLEVQQKEKAAEAFRLANGLSIASGGEASSPQSAEVQTMLVQARADLAEKEARLRQVQGMVASGSSTESIANALNSAVIGQMRSQESDAARKLAELRQRYSDEHPAVQAALTELKDVRERIADEARRIREGLKNEVEVARARLGTLQGSFGTAAGVRDGDNEAVVQYRELVREAAAARAVHESFLQRFHEVSNQGDLPIATSRLVSAALAPSAPSAPKIPQAFLMAAAAGLLAGAALGYLVELLDRSMSHAQDAERKLNMPVLASIPLLQESDTKGVAPDSTDPANFVVERPMSGFAEALRVLRSAVVHARVDQRIRVLAITSALPDEGKTTMALSLARIAALSGQSVVLVDCDLRRRSLNLLLGLEPTQGLLDVLMGHADWRRVLVRDERTQAHILPVAASAFTPRDVFSSAAMTGLVEELRATYDLVIFDCAPALLVAETRALALQADATLAIVRADKTAAPAVKSALRDLKKTGADVLGVALNCVRPRALGGMIYGDATYYRHAKSNYYSQ